MQRFLDLFISIGCCTCFRRFLCPSSGAQNCTYSVRYCQTNTAAIVDEMEHSSISSTIVAGSSLFISIDCSTCFRRFLRSSSGAQNCTYCVRYCQTNTAAIVDEMERSSISSTIAAGSSLFISIDCSKCFRRFLRPSSGAQNCTYCVRYCQTNTAACCYRG